MLSFAALGLRRNPFGEVPADERAALCVQQFDVVAAAARLQNTKHALQLMGPEGSGKSTHLYALQRCFSACPVSYVPEGKRVALPAAAVVFVDESQRLSRWSRFWLFRRKAAVVLATHRCHAAELRAAGRTVETHRLRGLDIEALGTFVAGRLAWAERPSGARVVVSEELLGELHRAHGHDVRAAGDVLYDWVQAKRKTEV